MNVVGTTPPRSSSPTTPGKLSLASTSHSSSHATHSPSLGLTILAHLTPTWESVLPNCKFYKYILLKKCNICYSNVFVPPQGWQ